MTSRAAQKPGSVRIGYRPPHELFQTVDVLAATVARAEALGIDRVCVGDHVSFRGGLGFDGLVQSTAVAMLSSRLTVQTAVYLLALRHPVPVARQVASLAALAPGRFVFGVGAGGDDRAEVELCGVDPTTRGRRMDEALSIVRALLAGDEVTFEGEFFRVDRGRIRPSPPVPVPIVVGGRSSAALARTARLGDGWLALWLSPERYAQSTAEVEEQAAAVGRTGVAWQHGLHAWCGIGPDRESARPLVAAAMEALYRVPFERFERWVPCGTPDDLATELAAYVDAGCRDINLIPVAADSDEAVEGVSAVRRLLNA
ncbi:MAG TPA: LLM class flavin-dependent oxidoreductase [Acidimicrobiales bacterium]|nr:LLM class flavin-dependent oxidoreductase [Acidimicrobiales bacterium]